MDKSISAAEANRKFSSVLREVRQGGTYVITSHGKPVAKLVPVEPEKQPREAARKALFDRLRNQPTLDVGPWTRDELYDE